MQGGDDQDSLWGDDGTDTLAGQMGNDMLAGGAGNESLVGGEDDDSLSGDDGDDVLLGDHGNDLLSGGLGADDLAGGAGNDQLAGGADDGAADTLYGQDGDDILDLGAGDYAAGQEGADSFVLHDYVAGSPTAVISDFEMGQDRLILIYDAGLHPTPDVTFEEDPETGDATLVLDGVPLATVLGGAGMDLSAIEIRAA